MVGDPAGGQADRQAAGDGLGDLGEGVAIAEVEFLALRRAQGHEEGDHGDAVVEQAFADDEHAKLLGQAGAAEQSEDNDRVGGGEDGAEHGAPVERNVHAEPGEDLAHANCHQQGGRDDAGGGEHEDAAALAPEGGDVDVQAAGEQQEGQRTVQQHVRQVGRLQHTACPLGEVDAGDPGIHRHQQAGCDQGEHQHADQVGQPEEEVIEHAEQRGQQEEQGGERESGHAWARWQEGLALGEHRPARRDPASRPVVAGWVLGSPECGKYLTVL